MGQNLDMLYDFYDTAFQTGGLNNSLVPGTLNQILYIANPGGMNYTWVGI